MLNPREREPVYAIRFGPVLWVAGCVSGGSRSPDGASLTALLHVRYASEALPLLVLHLLCGESSAGGDNSNQPMGEIPGQSRVVKSLPDADACRRVPPPMPAELDAILTAIIARIARHPERRGLLVRDLEASHLTRAPGEDAALEILQGHSIAYRIAVGPHEGRKAFTLEWGRSQPVVMSNAYPVRRDTLGLNTIDLRRRVD